MANQYADIQRKRKAAMFVSPKTRARRAARGAKKDRRDAVEAEQCRLRMLAVLDLTAATKQGRLLVMTSREK